LPWEDNGSAQRLSGQVISIVRSATASCFYSGSLVRARSLRLPDPARVGDHRFDRLLRDAVRLSTRAGADPFRSFARIAVEPRPYQLVPLLLALRLDPVRLLIGRSIQPRVIRTTCSALPPTFPASTHDGGESPPSPTGCRSQWHPGDSGTSVEWSRPPAEDAPAAGLGTQGTP